MEKHKPVEKQAGDERDVRVFNAMNLPFELRIGNRP